MHTYICVSTQVRSRIRICIHRCIGTFSSLYEFTLGLSNGVQKYTKSAVILGYTFYAAEGENITVCATQRWYV